VNHPFVKSMIREWLTGARVASGRPPGTDGYARASGKAPPPAITASVSGHRLGGLVSAPQPRAERLLIPCLPSDTRRGTREFGATACDRTSPTGDAVDGERGAQFAKGSANIAPQPGRDPRVDTWLRKDTGARISR
jgi:hypothetical protein